MPNTTYAMISVIVVSLISLVGLLAFALDARLLRHVVFLSVGFAAGALYGDALIHLIPEAIGNMQGRAAVYVLAGILIFFILEKALRWRHEHNPDRNDMVMPVGYLNLFADGLHNYIDGILIGSAYLIDMQIGLATTVAVILHEIPQEIGDFGILLHAGFSRSQALLLNLLTGALAILGTLTSFLLSGVIESFAMIMLPLAAGGFIYIAGSDLIPELQHEGSLKRSAVQLVTMVAGAGLMMLFG